MLVVFCIHIIKYFVSSNSTSLLAIFQGLVRKGFI